MPNQALHRKLPRESVIISRLGYDDLPTVRYIHAACFAQLAGSLSSETDVSRLVDHILSQGYTDRLAAAVRKQNIVGARYQSELVATANWTARGSTARLDALLVRPLMTGLGIGTLLLEAVETQAVTAGYRELAVSGAIAAQPFFEERGYDMLSAGALSVGAGTLQLPVAFMRKTLPGAGVSASAATQAITPTS